MASNEENRGTIEPKAALQGMGTLLRTGTRAMQELVVAHLTEDTTSEELRLFLRSLHRSGSTAKVDVVLLFPSSPMPTSMAKVIQEEEESFQKLVENFNLEAEPAMATASSTPTGQNPNSNFRSPFLVCQVIVCRLYTDCAHIVCRLYCRVVLTPLDMTERECRREPLDGAVQCHSVQETS